MKHRQAKDTGDSIKCGVKVAGGPESLIHLGKWAELIMLIQCWIVNRQEDRGETSRKRKHFQHAQKTKINVWTDELVSFLEPVALPGSLVAPPVLEVFWLEFSTQK